MIIQRSNDQDILDLMRPRDMAGLTRLKYFYPEYTSGHVHFVAIQDEIVIGVIALSNLEPDKIHIEYVTVSPESQNKGIGRALLSQAFGYAANHQKPLQIGRFSEDGDVFLKGPLASLSKATGVAVIKSL